MSTARSCRARSCSARSFRRPSSRGPSCRVPSFGVLSFRVPSFGVLSFRVPSFRVLTFRVPVLVLALALLAAPVAAQRSQDAGRGPDREEMERRFRAQVQRMIQNRLELSEEQSQQLTDLSAPFERRRRELGREEFTVRREVESLLEGGAPDESRARVLLNRLVELRAAESALFAEEQDALLSLLTPAQVLELHEFRRELGERIRNIRRRDDGRGGRRGGDAGPWLER